MRSPTLASQEELTPVQLRIEERIREFDLVALLRTLFSLGYSWGDFLFSSCPSMRSVDSLCQHIRFISSKVEIFLNLGLLASNSPLPSFFFKLMDDDTIGGELFQKYLHFFDHHLLNGLMQSTAIEHNRAYFPSWREAQRDYFTLAGLDSLATFALLIQLTYPDFSTSVTKRPKSIPIRESAFSLGKPLGRESIIGGNATKTYTSFHVVITTDEPCYKIQTPWPIEIRRRLAEYLSPLLSRVEIHLSLLLIIRGHEGRMKLSPASYLGFEPLGKGGAPFELLVFYGRTRAFIS